MSHQTLLACIHPLPPLVLTSQPLHGLCPLPEYPTTDSRHLLAEAKGAPFYSCCLFFAFPGLTTVPNNAPPGLPSTSHPHPSWTSTVPSALFSPLPSGGAGEHRVGPVPAPPAALQGSQVPRVRAQGLPRPRDPARPLPHTPRPRLPPPFALAVPRAGTLFVGSVKCPSPQPSTPSPPCCFPRSPPANLLSFPLLPVCRFPRAGF